MVGGAGTGVERVAGQPAGDSIVGYFRRLVPLGRFRFAQLSRGQDRPQAVLAAFLSHAKVVVAVACVLIAAEKEEILRGADPSTEDLFGEAAYRNRSFSK